MASRRKIAITIADLDLGGGQRVAINLAIALAKHHDVTIVIFQDDDIHYEPPGNLVNIQCPQASSLIGKVYNVFKRTRKLKQLIKKEKFDSVFGFMESANFPTALAFPNAALSVHCNPRELSFFEKLLVKWTYPKVKHVISVSDDVATILKDDFGLNNVSRIYNPVNPEDIAKEVDAPFQHDKPYIVALGRFHEVKRFDLLVEAFSKTRAKEECDLIIIGDGDLRGEIEAKIETLNMQEHVVLAGLQSNPFPYLAGAKFLTLSSRTEAFPMVLIEALALEVPVIATDCPTGPREIVKPNENGFLVENENADDLAKAIDALYFDDALRKTFSNNAIGSISHLLGEAIAKEWLALK